MAHHDSTLSPREQRAKNIKRIWTVAGILALVTAIEFVFAFTMEAGSLRNFIFIFLTLVKAAYIVAEFMHLRHETKVLIFAILLPSIFIFWLIGSMLWEGSDLFQMRF
ncbi:cytochrome C oxidase subunit IV family protein [Hugenholtzia roseola]|uniref:cytochrome C oxidase subunit IV family protein n=1 Tax=Hugenholtzia roseola TaxID=1002 RepID=UPI00040D2F39|nr:cytochrome C oxidase subunit IV family protein [Hugenholtzia roseola]